jgi:hypothetical protein
MTKVDDALFVAALRLCNFDSSSMCTATALAGRCSPPVSALAPTAADERRRPAGCGAACREAGFAENQRRGPRMNGTAAVPRTS